MVAAVVCMGATAVAALLDVTAAGVLPGVTACVGMLTEVPADVPLVAVPGCR